MRRTVIAMILGWAVIGATIALSSLPDVNANARGIVVAATLIGVAAAVAAAETYRRGRPVPAIVLLAMSLMVPTFFAWALSLLPLVAIVAVARSMRRTGEHGARQVAPVRRASGNRSDLTTSKVRAPRA